MPPLAGNWHSLLMRHVRTWKAAAKQVQKAVQSKVAQPAQAELQPVFVRARQPLHPAARIRQTQSRWFSSSSRSTFKDTVRRLSSIAEQASGNQYKRSSLPKSTVGNAVIRNSGRAPFASTLRPNLTGGTLGRTSGGYSLGGGRVGGQRYFSHGPASQAQVVQNVSQAVRAFFVSGNKAQFNGVNPRGEKSYKTVTLAQHDTAEKLRSLPKQTPGSYISFPINPTITALTTLEAVAGYADAEHVNSEGLLDGLTVDFSRSLKDLTAVLSDLSKLSNLGDLPITYEGSSLRIHFPGCDADTVDKLRDELQIQRGTTVQDEDFDDFVGSEIALLFPFAPSTQPSDSGSEFYESPSGSHTKPIDWQTMLTPSESSVGRHLSMKSDTLSDVDYEFDSPAMVSDYESLHYSSSGEHEDAQSPLEYQGFEGIYRFIEQCDSHRH
ncbi:hypothetical protein D6D23_01693 [Aureobasidium pullulans]|uniref:Casein kinase II beta 2 subunit n=1 Tax=Aureobasidium pullulans TaxID=5580 RepID=A0A4S8ZHV0_AURPU|nr:hypothetical protein D6D23_01693 [Aureobasidium pullulans]THW65481.1 hypothetical protein D6D20_02128 [Aureobasidium pullulans]THY05852.1 hypothetical protein D6D03_02776 [Aureobasidium pullulans]THZ77260.1 hypothetical protein D6C85_01784 [Aureobasidium pullulans]TIA03599.1 hypothetical protein D6C82_01668 [Aureobasidium pullulans]